MFRESYLTVVHFLDVSLDVLCSAMSMVFRNSDDQNPKTTCDNLGSSESASALLISASHKAGIAIDRTKIDEILLRESGDCDYMKQQRKRNEIVNRKIQTMKEILNKKDLTQPNWGGIMEQKLNTTKFQTWLSVRDSPPVYGTAVLVDMDSFYISCELLNQSHLQNVPCCVGSCSSIISTSNYAARKYGVRAAMPGWIAAKLVSELSDGKEKLRFLPHNFELYNRMSLCVKGVLEEYDPWLKCYSLDEAYMDLTPYFQLRLGKGLDHDSVAKLLSDRHRQHLQPESNIAAYNEGNSLLHPVQILEEMRAKVFEKTGLTCSAGLASNHMLAKIASDINKPNGQLCIGTSQNDILSFIRPLPVRKIPGIGRVMEQTLNAFQIHTVADLYEQRAILPILFKDGAMSEFLLRATIGLGSEIPAAAEHNNKKIEDFCAPKEKGRSTTRPATPATVLDSNGIQKGISRERTFSTGRSWLELINILEGITSMLVDDMNKERVKARTITVKIKLHTFDVINKSKSLPYGIFFSNKVKDMVAIAQDLMAEAKRSMNSDSSFSRPFNCRLLGIRCSNLAPLAEQSPGCSHLPNQQTRIDSFISFSTAIPQPRLLRQDTAGKQPVASLEDIANQIESDRSVSNEDNVLTTRDAGIAEISDRSENEMLSGAVSSFYCCPVCNKEYLLTKNVEINQHIDLCLNSKTVTQLVKEHNSKKRSLNHSSPSNRKCHVKDFFKIIN